MTSQRSNIVVMGVAGSGKTTVGKALANALGATFLDGDDYHPKANVEKMAAGHPLTDEDRAEWLATLADLLSTADANSAPIVLACSALKADYRNRLRGAAPPVFVFLDINPEVARQRLSAREHHFMPSSLIDSQFAALEAPSDALRVDALLPLPDVINVALGGIARARRA